MGADSSVGKPVMAMSCLCMSIDWTVHALVILQFNEFSAYDVLIMSGHSISILWASLFFYNRAIKNGKRIAWLSLLLQWIDLVFCSISLLVLHSQEGSCLDQGICIGYFVVLILNLFCWFFPIIFGFSDTEKHIHIHMLVLDLFTDFPLVVVIILTESYTIHWWIFIDIIFKLIMILRSIAYHFLLKLENKLYDQGATNEEIEIRTIELKKQQTADAA